MVTSPERLSQTHPARQAPVQLVAIAGAQSEATQVCLTQTCGAMKSTPCACRIDRQCANPIRSSHSGNAVILCGRSRSVTRIIVQTPSRVRVGVTRLRLRIQAVFVLSRPEGVIRLPPTPTRPPPYGLQMRGLETPRWIKASATAACCERPPGWPRPGGELGNTDAIRLLADPSLDEGRRKTFSAYSRSNSPEKRRAS